MTEPERLEGFPGRYWHRLEDGRIQCDICPRYCRLGDIILKGCLGPHGSA